MGGGGGGGRKAIMDPGAPPAAAAVDAATIRGDVRLKALKSFCGVLTACGTPPFDSSEVSESM